MLTSRLQRLIMIIRLYVKIGSLTLRVKDIPQSTEDTTELARIANGMVEKFDNQIRPYLYWMLLPHV